MIDHRAAIDDGKRTQRRATASTADETRLAEVESAVTESKEELDRAAAEVTELVANQRITQTVAEERMAKLRVQHQTLIQKLKKDIVDPIAKKTEDAARAVAFVMPERNDDHREASKDYRSKNIDGKQDMISQAIVGNDDVLAVALLTGRDEITDITREHLMKRLSPGDDNTHQILNMATRVQATLNTIGE